MRSIEISAKTVEEALNEGILQLGVKKENVKVEVLNEPAQGILKFLSAKPAKVKLTIIKEADEYIKDFLEKLLYIIGLEGNVMVEEENEEDICFNIYGKNLGLLIGKRGNTLNALQYLTNVVLHRQFMSENRRTIIDIENYRHKRKMTLEQLARNIALKVLRTKKEVSLEPMTPQERRIIHLALKNNRDVITYSDGNEPYRKVVIAPR